MPYTRSDNDAQKSTQGIFIRGPSLTFGLREGIGCFCPSNVNNKNSSRGLKHDVCCELNTDIGQREVAKGG